MSIVSVCETCACTTIACAVAASEAGDQIQLAAGLYPESVKIEHSLRLRASPNNYGQVAVITGSLTSTEPAITVFGDVIVRIEDVWISTPVVRPLDVRYGADVRVSAVVLRSTGLQNQGGVVYVNGARLSFDHVEVLGGDAFGEGGLVYLQDSQFVATQSHFRSGRGELGGAVFLLDTAYGVTSFDADSCEFDGNSASSGAAIGTGGLVTLSSTFDTFSLGEASSEGGAIAILGLGTLVSSGDRFLDNSAVRGGALYVENGVVSLSGAVLKRNDATFGSAIVAIDTAMTVERTVFERNDATGAGTVYLGEPLATSLVYDDFIGNNAGSAPAVYTFCAAATVDIGGDIVAWQHTDGNEARNAAIYADRDCVDIHDSVFYANDGGDGDDAGGLDVHADPRFLFWDDGNADDDERYYVSWYGAARDAGPPDDPVDPDQTRPDAGVYGGSDANPRAWADDLDMDGTPEVYDCAPGDPTRFVDAPDTPYDGVDQDCDRWSDYDADRDGFDDERHLGNDCDDADRAIWPGAPEVPYDGVDQDCDGHDVEDVDGDGFLSQQVVGGTDCDDADPHVNPAAVDHEPDVDRNCDGYVDEPGRLKPAGCSTATDLTGGFAAFALAFALRRRRR